MLREQITVTQSNNLPRVVDLEAGVVMVVTDLHGDWDAYRRYRDRFLELQARGQADHLIFTGDLIHSDGPPQDDHSLDIVLDVLELRESLGERLIYLLGNHEMPHLYGIMLSKGKRIYTPRFEAAMGVHRADIIALLNSLPFYVRTRGGVSVCHAGATSDLVIPGAMRRVFRHSHTKLREMAAAKLPPDRRAALRAGFAKLSGEPYDYMARHYLAVSSPKDPRYDDLLVGFVASSYPNFDLLWAALFTRNEQQYGLQDYAIFLDALLRDLSEDYQPQEALVTGHIPCQGGYTLVVGRQLRLASGPHAYPRQSARYLLFDAARPVRQADELVKGLKSIFD